MIRFFSLLTEAAEYEGFFPSIWGFVDKHAAQTRMTDNCCNYQEEFTKALEDVIPPTSLPPNWMAQVHHRHSHITRMNSSFKMLTVLSEWRQMDREEENRKSGREEWNPKLEMRSSISCAFIGRNELLWSDNNVQTYPYIKCLSYRNMKTREGLS